MDYERPSYSRDSIMDQNNHTFDSAFGQNGSHSMHSISQFRVNDDSAFSVFSAEGESADPECEDDTMISVGVSPSNINFDRMTHR
jgi:hypothetical protein